METALWREITVKTVNDMKKAIIAMRGGKEWEITQNNFQN